jgi:GAF domain-containing protein
MDGARKGSSIAARVSVLTFLAVVTAAVLLAIIAVLGVYRLTLAEDASRVQAYRQVLVDDVDGRLATLDRAVASLASDPATKTGPDGGAVFAHSSGSDTSYFSQLALVDVAGRTLASSVPATPDVPSAVAAMVVSSRPEHTSLAWLPGEGGATSGLWLVRGATVGGGRRAIVGLARDAYLAEAVNRLPLSALSVYAFLVDATGRPVDGTAERVPFDLGVTTFGSLAASGPVTVDSPSLGVLQGSSGTVGPATGLNWHVVVLDSQSASMARARDALAPAGLAMLAVVLVAVLFALLVSRRLISPLRLFERTAREVASGGYIRPVPVDRDDEIGRMAEAFNEMGVRLNSLQDMAHLLASAANMDDSLDAVLEALGRILGTGDAAVLLADESHASLVLARGRGLAIPGATFVAELADESSPLVRAYRTQEPVRFAGDESESAGSVHQLFGADARRRGIAVPLTAGSEPLGVVVVLGAGSRELSAANVDTLTAFSANAAVAVHTSRLFADEHLSRTEAEALRRVAELTMPAADLAHAVEQASAVAAGLLGYAAWGVVIERREQLGLKAAQDEAADSVLTSVWRLVLAAHPDREPADTSPIVVDDAREEPHLEAMLGDQWGSALFVPLVQTRTTRGAIVLHDRTGHARPSDKQLAVARTIGQEVSLAIRNAHLLQEARTRATNLETLFRISQAVSSELQPNVVLNRVLDVVQKILSADAVALMSYDDTRSRIETSMARGVTRREILYFSATAGEDVPGQVFLSRAPLVYGGLSHRPTPFAALAADEGFESLLAVPLMARGRAIGVLMVLSRRSDAFSGEDMELLMTFASQAAIAIDTAALYGKEHHVATVLQASILPEVLPAVPGLETASFYLPSGSEAEIGGDYYDMFRTGDGRVALAIGDVCGKGVAAATKTSMIKYALRGLIGAGLSPAMALSELNRQVVEAGDPSDIVTVWLGLLDVGDDSLVYANGGHPPGLLVRGETREVERLSATGPLLGALPESTYEERWLALGDHDLLLLYTDGVTEARRGTHFFGEGRLRRILRGCADAEGCIQRLLSSIDKYSPGPLRDDAAALAVRVVRGDR